ncbi:hypothetical protein GCM10009665_67530 [Kitasatospora nipponensis]|uniref:Uncharacterized protein n=1 Tax=Kitasatospora nipponensis TaxID=258049 RepID=A0ABP4HN40_9ACTN
MIQTTGGPLTTVYRLQLGQGNVGETVGHATTTVPSQDVVCGAADILLSASAHTVVISESLTSSTPGCGAQVAEEVTLTLNSSGSLQVSQIGFASSELLRQ